MTALSVTIGVIVSFLLSEFTGFLSGGLVVPGYIALYVERPFRVVVTFGLAGISFLIVRLLSRRIVLFGRRRFMAFILTGMFVNWLGAQLLARLPSMGQDFRAIGYIIPGLIANDAWKQGFWKTCLFCLIAAAATRLMLVVAG